MRASSLMSLLLLLAACGPLNEPPSAPVVAIDPAEPGDNDLLTCAVVEDSVDPDGDAVTYSYSWWVDEQELGAVDVEPHLVPGEQTLPGEVWRCVVTPSDLSEDGPTGEDEVTIGG